MTNKDFTAWKKRGTFTLSHDRILQVSNNIAEGEHNAYTKKEAAEVAMYHSLDVAMLNDHISAMKTKALLEHTETVLQEVNAVIKKYEPTCKSCGNPKSNHPYRHPFVEFK
jgi:hypothetical protein